MQGVCISELMMNCRCVEKTKYFNNNTSKKTRIGWPSGKNV
jgi:hypothetical protein